MFLYNISRLIVIKDNKPIGIITEKDITRYLIDADKPINQIKVFEVVSYSRLKSGACDGGSNAKAD
jgi:predicted transcriptional regulator